MMRRFYQSAAFLFVALTSVAVWAYTGEGSHGGAEGAGGVHDVVAEYDHLWNEVMIDLTVIGVIFSLVLFYFIFAYRRKTPGQQGKGPKLTPTQVVGWALIPLFIFVADDFFLAAKGWDLWNSIRRVPENSYEVKVEGSMWSWRFTHPNGVETYGELRVPAGRPVVVRMTSADAVHSFFVPDFRIKEDLMPGRVTYLWFYPKKPGEHLLTCAEYCGVLHSSMHGKIIAMPEGEFNAWLNSEKIKLAKGGA